jgi:hypothetical protein
MGRRRRRKCLFVAYRPGATLSKPGKNNFELVQFLNYLSRIDCSDMDCSENSNEIFAEDVIVTTSAPVVLGIEFEPLLSQNKSVALRSGRKFTNMKQLFRQRFDPCVNKSLIK